MSQADRRKLKEILMDISNSSDYDLVLRYSLDVSGKNEHEIIIRWVSKQNA